MKRTERIAKMAITSFTVFFTVALLHAAASAQKTAAVTVTNTDANPVPVRGGVSVTNTPTVDARQSGDWAVGISGTPTVKLDPSAVVSIANEPGRQWTSFNLITNERTYTPPSEKTLVLEYVSGVITLANQFGAPTLRCSSIGTVLPKMSRPFGSTDTTWYFSEMVRGYADQTNPVSCDTDFATVTQFIFTVKGHFVNGVREQ